MKTSQELRNELLSLSDQLIEQGRELRLQVGGLSMWPYMRAGDIAYIRKVSINDVKRGDVVVFKTSVKWIAHRLVRIQSHPDHTVLITRGDSCWRTDHPVTLPVFVGKVYRFRRKEKTYDLETPFQQRLAKILIYLQPLFYVLLRVFRRLRIVKRSLPIQY